MPNRDGTGPAGKGPGTGRKMGSCGTGGARSTRNQGRGRGQGRAAGGRFFQGEQESQKNEQ